MCFSATLPLMLPPYHASHTTLTTPMLTDNPFMQGANWDPIAPRTSIIRVVFGQSLFLVNGRHVD